MISYNIVQKKINELNEISGLNYSTEYLINSWSLFKGNSIICAGESLEIIHIVIKALVRNYQNT